MNFLSGYKTYITGAAAILTAAGLYASGTDTAAEAVQLVITALLGMFIRSGVTTTATS